MANVTSVSLESERAPAALPSRCYTPGLSRQSFSVFDVWSATPAS
jgi:hypothetical protein